MRKIKAVSGKSKDDLAAEFGVSESAIRGIVRASTWQWLEV